MSFFGKLFGTEKALTGIVDGVSSGLDKLVYTDEEKADAAAKDRSEARAMVVGWMAATQGQNLARRLIALSITGAWLGLYLISVVTSFIAIFVGSDVTVNKLLAASALSKNSAIELNNAVMLILAFYFAAPHMGDIAKAVSGKFIQSTNKG